MARAFAAVAVVSYLELDGRRCPCCVALSPEAGLGLSGLIGSGGAASSFRRFGLWLRDYWFVVGLAWGLLNTSRSATLIDSAISATNTEVGSLRPVEG